HLGEQAQSNGDDLAVLGESSDGLVQEALLFRRRLSTVGREAAECSAEFGQDLPRVQPIEEIDQTRIVTFDQGHFQVVHESAADQPEIVAHQEERLDVQAVALSQRLDQLS